MYDPEARQVLDWTTAAIYMRDRLMLSGNCPRAVAVVFEPVEAFSVTRTRQAESSVSIPSVLDSDQVACHQKWAVLKMLALCLRWCFLRRSMIIDVRIVLTGLQSLQLKSTADELTIKPATALEVSGQLALQGGRPAMWYRPDAWRKLRPAPPEPSRSDKYPLSSPSYFDSLHTETLERLGAQPVGAGFWVPPFATTTEDLQAFLQSITQGEQGAA
jgi:hypothetical protein